MKKSLIIVLLVLSGFKLISQNNVYELYKYQDKDATKYYFNFIIRAASLNNVARITLYKKIASQSDPLFVKEVYVNPFNSYYLIQDGKNTKFTKNYFMTLFTLYKDEYTQITGLSYTIFFNNGQPQSFTIPKP